MIVSIVIRNPILILIPGSNFNPVSNFYYNYDCNSNLIIYNSNPNFDSNFQFDSDFHFNCNFNSDFNSDLNSDLNFWPDCNFNSNCNTLV